MEIDNENSVNSPIRNIFRNIALYLSEKIHSKLPFIQPNHITTFGIILNACALMNLLNRDFSIFIILFIMAYFCDVLDGVYARKYNMETKAGKFYDKFADWVKLISTYVMFSTLYKRKITLSNITIILIILIACNFHFIVKNNLKKTQQNSDNHNETKEDPNIVQNLLNNKKIENIDTICIDFWVSCFKKVSIKELKYYNKFTKYFDETMIIVYLILMMVYIHYK